MWLAYALLGAVITGIGQVLVKKGQVKLTPLLDNLLAAIIVNLILVPILLIRGVNLNPGGIVIVFALIAATMYASFYYIISIGKVSLMVSLINTFPVVTIVLAISYLHEFPNLYQWLGIILLISGVICISREKVKGKVKKNKKLWVVWGLLGALAIGIAEFVTKLATFQVDGFTFTFFVYVMYLPLIVIFMVLDKKGRRLEMLRSKSNLLPTIIGIFFIEVGLIAIALAYQFGSASLVSPVIATHLLVTVVLAAIFLKEKLLPVQKLGILLTIVGVSIIGIFS